MADRKSNRRWIERSQAELPDDIIQHIFSYIDLTNQKALSLSRLSKQFQRVLQNCPTLVFDSRLIHRGTFHHVYKNRYRDELNYIRSTLDRYNRENIQLESFTLIAVDSIYAPLMVEENIYHRCIELAATDCLKNLNLELITHYVLPQQVFGVKSLVELNLRYCCLKPNGMVAWPNLKRLSISVGTRVADEKAFETIINGCPSIEYLEVNSRSFVGNFNFIIFDLPNLKQLEFVFRLNQRLDMNATPNLESMRCSSSNDIPYHDSYFLGFGSNEYPSLRSLEVTCGELDENFFINFEHRFPKLEKLILSRTLERINLSSTSLKELKLIDNMTLHEACFDAPNLVHFEYENYRVIPKLTFAGNSGRWSSCIKLKEYPDSIDSSWFLELSEFLAALNMSELNFREKEVFPRWSFQ